VIIVDVKLLEMGEDPCEVLVGVSLLKWRWLLDIYPLRSCESEAHEAAVMMKSFISTFVIA
jgi:hypothetical protein